MNMKHQSNKILSLILLGLILILIVGIFFVFNSNQTQEQSQPDLTISNSTSEATIGADFTGVEVERDNEPTPELDSESDSQADSATIWAPFYHIIPSDDGKELILEVSNISAVGVPIHFNIVGIEHSSIGPSNYEHSYAPSSSETTDKYIVTAPGIEPEVAFVGAVNITATTGINSKDVNFSRYYVQLPIDAPIDFNSEDGLFQVTLINSGTIESDTYFVLAENDFPPGPVAEGFQFMSKYYSLRPHGASLAAGEPMPLRMYYDNLFLQGVDPFTLAIFYWNENSREWMELNGRLFFNNQFISITTTKFATFALLSAPRWYDDFDDVTGLSETDNITLGVQNRIPEQLVLVDGTTTGYALSRPIMPSKISQWDAITFDYILDSNAAKLTVDILSPDGTVLLSNVTSGDSLKDINPVEHPALQVRANFSTTQVNETARLDSWRITWATVPNE